jgi:energy-coupling factor transporter ATP-binding protein EcfA2
MIPHNHSWLVDGPQLRTRSRQGGKNAIKGFEFQAIHAVNALVQLLTFAKGLIQVRYEGAQDVDLMFGDGTQLFIQYKESEFAEYSFDVLKDVLSGFVRDTIDACGDPPDATRLKDLKLSFLLVATGIFIGDDVASVVRGTNLAKWAEKLVEGFAYPDRAPWPPGQLAAAAEHVLSHITFQVTPKQPNNEDLRLSGIGRLALFGILPNYVEPTLSRIKELLNVPSEYFVGDVVACLEGLPDAHPASGRSALGFMPGEKTFPPRHVVEQAFRESGRPSWAAIHFGLDAPRDKAEHVYRQVLDLSNSGGVVLVCGPIGSGKSTLVRRIGWALHRSGAALVCEINDPDGVDNQSWETAARIARHAQKPLVLVVDELSRRSAVLEQIRRRPHDRTIVLATDRMAGALAGENHIKPHVFALDGISDAELKALCDQSGTTVGDRKRQDLTTLLRGGQMFSVSLVLRGSGLREHAEHVLHALRDDPDHYRYYVAVCLCGMDDQSVPQTILRRIFPGIPSWKSKRLEGLVFADALRERRIMSGHAALARSVIDVTDLDLDELRGELIGAVQYEESEERRFALRLILNTLATEKGRSKLASDTRMLCAMAARIADHGDYLDISRFQNLLSSMSRSGEAQLAAAMARLAKAKDASKVRTGQDAIAFLKDEANFEVSSSTALRVFGQPEISFGRNAFLRFIETHGKAHPRIRRLALDANLRWLAAHDYPAPEAKVVADYINYAIPDCAADYIGQVGAIVHSLRDKDASPSDIELLNALSLLIKDRLRDPGLFAQLIHAVERMLTPLEVLATPGFAMNLAVAARRAASSSDKSRTFRFLANGIVDVDDEQVRGCVFLLVQFRNAENSALFDEFLPRAQTLATADAKAFAHDFHAQMLEVLAAPKVQNAAATPAEA